MKRILKLSIIIFMISLSNFIGSCTLHINAFEEFTISDHFISSDNNQSLDTTSSDNHFAILQHLIIGIFLIISITITVNRFIKWKARATILTPVFYQSNYVRTSPLM
ncbi:hypothetical protein OEV98_14780 [Caldibacillus lycopersici]|uniref:Lipoprotein n=1 Tax=Perspicuibacillus lycopersici TaxID=1325689 RepID=A0AAE3IUM0_9BACI|nr:hypothetical protein [Perspicuibacillus lycopersici]MCU9614806.1 hypothetical protein [Perspicuibacillus lycopersici]